MSQANIMIFAAVTATLLVGWQIDRAQAWRQRHQVRTWRSGRLE